SRLLEMPLLAAVGPVGIIGPVIKRCVRLARRTDRTRRRQNGNLPKSRRLGRKTRPVHAIHPRIHNPNQMLVSQRGYAFTSMAVLPSATFVQPVAKKPHGAVNGGRGALPVAFLTRYRVP